MHKTACPLLAALSILLSGCASIPDVTTKYYLPETAVHVTVLRTIACDKNNYPIVASAVTPKANHSADTKAVQEFNLTTLRGAFSDTDVKFDFYDDGRLKGVNSTTEGKGEEILKTVVNLIVPVFALDGGSKTFPDECKTLASIDDGKPVTFTYEKDLDLSMIGTAQEVPPDLSSSYYANKVVPAIGRVCALVVGKKSGNAPVAVTKTGKGGELKLRAPGAVTLQVGSEDKDGKCSSPIWSGDLQVAQFGTYYTLPIPSPAAFGKLAFAASLSESGALTSLQYASTAGAGQALNVAGALANAAKGTSAADKAAELNARADLIAAQQRLVNCNADPASCAAK